MPTFRKPEPIPLLFIIAATATLVALGAWQVERLSWKNHLIAAIERAQAEPVLHILPPDLTGLDYRRVSLQGIFLHDKTLRLVGQPVNGRPGWRLFTPLKLRNGRFMLVNRGFAPEGLEQRPKGMQEVEGILRPPRERRLFTPDNQPDKNLWFHEDIAAMSAQVKLTLLPMVVEQVGARRPDTYPIPGDGKIVLRNDHLGYAITWFSLAVIGLIMFGFYYREKSTA